MYILLLVMVFCWLITIVRVITSSISSDLMLFKQARGRRQKSRYHLPTISVLIPAYNEEFTIARAIESVWSNDYPVSKFEIIVINDGSTDGTKEAVKEFKRTHKNGAKVRLINRPNKGKARALNYALRRCATGQLVTCLDADTYLNHKALRNAAQYFKNRKTVALCCYADIIEDGTMLALAQRIEYVMSYRYKSGHTHMGVNYIIPGTGSVFRRRMLKRIQYYESNTLTEDLDLTMKILANKKRDERIDYAPDVVAYTEAVHSMGPLVRQRFRWSYGRAQVFLKYSNLFFSRNSQHNKRLTWGMLPFSLVQDLAFLLSPVVALYLTYYAFHYGNLGMISGGTLAVAVYLAMCIWSVEHLSLKDKLRLTYYAPPMYLIIYVTAAADYYALMKAILLAPKLKASIKQRHFTWRSPERRKEVVASTV